MALFCHNYIKFEFDPAKSTCNKAMYAVDFVEAQQLRDGEDLLALSLRFKDEQRIA